MCGRFTNRLTWGEIVALYRLTAPAADRAPNLEPRYNIAPTQEVSIVRPTDGGRALVVTRWGLVPGWAKDVKIGARMINARAETVAEKPAYREAFARRRCLVPADGFYEWRQEGKVRQPYHFALRDGGGFAFAGLWESWADPAGSQIVTSAIVTTTPNAVVGDIHDRMPVILEPSDYETWLTGTKEEAAELMRPFPAEQMTSARASLAVNSYKNDGPELLLTES